VVESYAGTHLTRSGAARIVRRVARGAGVEAAISPHSLRHTFVTLALEAGVPLHVVQDGAGHADPRTTRRCDRARHSLDAHSTYALTAWLDG
jgi:integrase/recombinase XerD